MRRLGRLLDRSLALAPDAVRRSLDEARTRYRLQRLRDRTKFFGIGRNKTGTTTLKAVFRRHGFVVGDQPEAELLAHHNYFDGRFDWLDTYCQTAEFFQDVPFSWPDTFLEVDQRFPGSRFILTVRDDEHQWYDSLVRFQAKITAGEGLPSAEQLKTHPYRTIGYLYDTVRVHGTPDEDPYDEATLKAHYLRHNQAVRDYFAARPGHLLEINVGRPEDYPRLMAFLGIDDPDGSFPVTNRSR